MIHPAGLSSKVQRLPESATSNKVSKEKIWTEVTSKSEMKLLKDRLMLICETLIPLMVGRRYSATNSDQTVNINNFG